MRPFSCRWTLTCMPHPPDRVHRRREVNHLGHRLVLVILLPACHLWENYGIKSVEHFGRCSSTTVMFVCQIHTGSQSNVGMRPLQSTIVHYTPFRCTYTKNTTWRNGGGCVNYHQLPFCRGVWLPPGGVSVTLVSSHLWCSHGNTTRQPRSIGHSWVARKWERRMLYYASLLRMLETDHFCAARMSRLRRGHPGFVSMVLGSQNPNIN